MFDDYKYKHTNQRIELRFIQNNDEPIYPWEIAAFLNRLNTVYYKYELLNSICSAIENGISPEDIFIFDKSLPLYKRNFSMNLISEENAAKILYNIGNPYPLKPNQSIYNFNFLYSAFSTINSFLYKNHIQTIRTSELPSAYLKLQEFGIDYAEEYIIDLAIHQSQNSKRYKSDGIIISRDEIKESLGKYYKHKEKTTTLLRYIEKLSDIELQELDTQKTQKNRKEKAMLTAFFDLFSKTTRPLVCARVASGKFRVLGRSLINKKEQTGLELREARRYSPLNVLVEGGIALLQTIVNNSRQEEMHALEVQKKQIEIEQEKEKLYGEKLKNKKLEIEILEKMSEISKKSDIGAANRISSSFFQRKIENAYCAEDQNARTLLFKQDLHLDQSTVRLLDVNA